MLPKWPSSLPNKILTDGFEERPMNVQIRTQMDEGPDKVRRWGVAGTRGIVGAMEMTKEQLDTFDDFYNTTLRGGTLRFEFEHPRTGETKEFRFKEDGVGYENLGGPEYRVSMSLEVLP